MQIEESGRKEGKERNEASMIGLLAVARGNEVAQGSYCLHEPCYLGWKTWESEVHSAFGRNLAID